MKRTKMIALLKNYPIAIFISMVLLFMSCGESVDPMKADINLQMKATSQLSTMKSNARVAESGIEFTEVIIGVTEIELESEEENHGNDDDNSGHSNDDSDDDGDDDNDSDGDDDSDDSDEFEIEYEGQFIVDLLNGTSEPDFGIADVIPGNYEEIEIKIRPILDDGNSIRIKFNYTKEGMDPVMVELSTTKEFKLEIKNEDGIQLEENALNQVLVLLDLDRLLSGIDLEIAEADSDGVVRINATSNSDVLSKIWSNIHYAFDAGEDDDDDDEIDDSDDD